MDPNQTAPTGAVTLFVYEASNILVDDKKKRTICDYAHQGLILNSKCEFSV